MSLLSNYHVLIFYWLCGLKLLIGFPFKYDVEIINDSILTPCDEYPEDSHTKFLDLSELSVIRNDDGSLTLEGFVKFIYNFKRQNVKGRIEFFKRERGAWHKTVYSLSRPDFCRGLFDGNEYWSPYFSKLPEENRKCPMTSGRIFNVSITTRDPVELPDRTMAGEYNGRVEAGDPGDDDFMCANFFLNLYRH